MRFPPWQSCSACAAQAEEEGWAEVETVVVQMAVAAMVEVAVGAAKAMGAGWEDWDRTST